MFGEIAKMDAVLLLSESFGDVTILLDKEGKDWEKDGILEIGTSTAGKDHGAVRLQRTQHTRE